LINSLSRSLSFAALVLILSCILSWPSIPAAEARSASFFGLLSQKDEATAVPIKPGETIEKSLQGGHSHTYSFEAKAASFFHCTVEQLGIDVVLTLYDPAGQVIGTMDSPNGDSGLEQISAVPATSGVFRLKIESQNKNARDGRYRLSLAASDTPSDADRARIAAEKLLMEAVQAGQQNTPTSLQQTTQKLQDSIPLWQQAGDLYELALTQETLAPMFAAQEQPAEAVKAYSSAIELWRQQKGTLREAQTAKDFGVFYYHRGAMKKALELYERALPLERSIGNKAGEGAVLNNIGEIYQDTGDKQKALDYFLQALPLTMEAGDVDDQGAILNNLGGIYDDLSKPQQALDYYLQALPKAREARNPAGESTILNNIARTYLALGEPRKTVSYAEEGIPLARNARDKRREAMARNNMAAALEQLGERQKSIEEYKASLELQRAVGDKAGEADSLNNLGVAYNALGQPERAIEYFNLALPIQQEAGLKPKVGITLLNIAEVYLAKGEAQEAANYDQQAFDLLKQAEDRHGQAAALEGLAVDYEALGNAERAAKLLMQAIDLYQEIGSRLGEGDARDVLAMILAKQGRLDEARQYTGEAVLLYHEVEDPLEEGVALGNLMEENALAGQNEAAIFFGKQAIEKFQLIRKNIRGLERQIQLSFVKKREGSYRRLAGLLISEGRLGEAQSVLNLLKDEEYFDFIRRDANEASSLTPSAPLTKKEDAVAKKYREQAASVAAIGNEWSALQRKKTRTPEEDKHLEELTAQLRLANQQWDQFLVGVYHDLQATKAASEAVENLEERTSGMQDLLRRLGPGTVALYTLVGEKKYQVILVTPQVRLAHEFPISSQDLRQKVLDFRESLQDPRSNPVPLAKELYKIIVAPVAADLAGAKAVTLMWSLDDVLRYLPVAALHDGSHYLVENFRNVEFTPASLARLEDRPAVATWKGLGLGVSKAYEGFPPLPAVPDELRRVIHEEGVASREGVLAGHVMLDDSFTEAAMKKSLERQYPLIHIASHFAFRPGNETDSFLLLGGAGSRGEHLTLAEMREDPAYSFSNTELITLSACDTAMGGTDSDGREIDGLGRVVQRRGAKAVVATLWAVEDQSTGVLMQEFYKAWTTGRRRIPKVEALRQAQLSLLKGLRSKTLADSSNGNSISGPQGSWTHPYYWAPFILIGNWK